MIDILGASHKKEIDQKAAAMQDGQSGIRASINELEEVLLALQQVNGKVSADQKKADELQREVISKMTEILTKTEEQEKKSADLTLHTLKRISDLIQMGDQEGGGEAEEEPK